MSTRTKGTRRSRRPRAAPPLLPFLEPPREVANELREVSMQQVARHADEHAPKFHARAVDFVLWFLARFGPAAGERITEACKLAGIQPHDDRAFGPVYMQLARQKVIEKVGAVRRERGHGTAGGNIWALRQGA